MTHRWDDLRVFLAVWRSGSLSAAARVLGVRDSTVGRRLDALEADLGVQLFERTPAGIVATLAAERLHPYADAVEQGHLAFQQALEGLEKEPVGTVRLTGPPGLIDHLIAPRMGELRARFPRLTVELDASVGYADLSRGEADIALRAMPPSRGDLIWRRVGPFGSAVLGSSDRFAGAAPQADLAALPWVQWGDELSHIPDARWVAAHVPESAWIMRTNSFAAQIEATRRGVTVMLAAAPFAELAGLCAVPLTGAAAQVVAANPGQSIYLIGHQALRRVPRVAAVWAFLLEELQAEG